MVKQIAAERERRVMIAQADGERQAAILRAEGQAKALELLNEVASKLGQNALLLQYLDALKAIATPLHQNRSALGGAYFPLEPD